MDRVVKGIVMEISKKSAVLMTSDGEFLNVKKPPQEITLGDEITSVVFAQEHKNHIIRYASIAALILLFLIPFTYFKVAYATVAYVNVDINPSLELSINKYNKVNDAVGLNSDGLDLLKKKSIIGLDIKDALNEIITEARDDGYIDDNKDNNIQVALVKLNPGNVNIDENSVMQYVKDAVIKTDVDAVIEVRSADKKIYDSAKKENMSTNRYMNRTQETGRELREDVKKSNVPANNGNGENNNGSSGKTNSNNNGKNSNNSNNGNSGSNSNNGNNGTSGNNGNNGDKGNNGSGNGNGSDNPGSTNPGKGKGGSGKNENNIKEQNGTSYQNDENNQSDSKVEEQEIDSESNSDQEKTPEVTLPQEDSKDNKDKK